MPAPGEETQALPAGGTAELPLSDAAGAGETSPAAAAAAALRSLQVELATVSLPYALPGSAETTARARLLADQLGDYVLPRLESLEAPLLAVVGGSTGAGKSTLVSSLVGSPVSAASAIRPTTRRPLLLHAPSDEPWFTGERVLGSLARIRVAEGAAPTPATTTTPRELELRACSALPSGLALLDAPDVDSVVEDNRVLASTLLASADLWVFVTTAARYADAVPWEHLRAAAARSIVVAVLLDRVPEGAAEVVEADLRRRLGEAGLNEAPVFLVPETRLRENGLLPDDAVAPLRRWLGSLAGDARARQAVARRTLVGAVGAAMTEGEAVLAGLRAQEAERGELARAAATAHDEAVDRVSAATEDGTMLRGEVLARWQEFVGTGELLRGLEAQVSRLRDRITAALRGRPAPAARVEDAIETSLAALLLAEAQRASLATERSWRRSGSAPAHLQRALAALPSDEDTSRAAAALVRQWQGAVLDLIRAEGADKRLTARILSLGVNGVGVALMILVFAHTGGLSGGEVGIAGGTAVLAQRVLEAAFGDQAMRTMAARARTDLVERTSALMASRAEVFADALPQPQPAPDALRTALAGARGLTAAVLDSAEDGTSSGGRAW